MCGRCDIAWDGESVDKPFPPQKPLVHHRRLSLRERSPKRVEDGGGERVVQRPEPVLRGERDVRGLLREQAGSSSREVAERPSEPSEKAALAGRLLPPLPGGLAELGGRRGLLLLVLCPSGWISMILLRWLLL